MSISSGPKVIKDSILVDLDAANFKSTSSTSITNTIDPFNAGYAVYNNPGFSTTITKTSEFFKGAPVYKVTYTPQNSTFISRLASGEGFGLYHVFGTSLLPDTYYMSSIYFKTKYRLENSSSEGFNNTYSNISGWGNSSTTSTRYREGEWTRLYTRFYNNTVVNGISYAAGTVYDTFQAIFNTSAQTDVLITLTIASNGAYTTVTPYGTLTSGALGSLAVRKVLIGATPYVSNAGSISGLAIGTGSILNHGLDTTNWTKLSTANYRLTENFPLTYYISIRIPSTGGVNRTVTFYPIFTVGQTSTSDQKFWKLTFNTSALATSDIIETYWAAPMMEQTTRTYPSPYVIGTQTKSFFTSTTWPDLSGNNNNATLVNGPVYSSEAGGSFVFDGTNDYADTGYDLSWNNTNSSTVSLFVKPATTNKVAGIIGKPSPNWEWAIMQDGTNLVFVYWDTGGGHSNGPTISLSNFFNSTANWMNITLTWSHTDNKIRIYKNGVLLNETTWTNASINQNRTNSVYLGGGIYTWATGYWSGSIANVSLYSRALTTAEVVQNFESFRKRFNI